MNKTSTFTPFERGLRRILFILLLLVIAIGCAAPPAPLPTAAPPAAPQPPAPAAPTSVPAPQPPPATAVPQPQRGGALVVRFWTGDPPDMDPYLNTSFRSQEFAGFFYSRLLKFNVGSDIQPNAFLPTGDLAEKWDISSDGLTYTFYLRKNAKWQNKAPMNGRAVTADDVIWSYNRFITSAVQKTVLTSIVKEVKKIDDTTVAFVLKEVSAPFENTIAQPIFWIMPKEVIEADGDARKRVVGSGPFIFDKFEKGVQVVAKRNPDYYFTGTPYVDELDLLIIPEDATAMAGMRAKQIDVNGVSQTDRNSLAATNPEVKFVDYVQNLLYIMYWRVDQPPFNDVRVRQAFSMALDREEQLKVLSEGRGTWNSAVPAGFGSWWVDPRSPEFGASGKYFKRDVAAAKQLLADAGYPNGIKVKMISTLNAYGNTFNQSVELAQKELKDAGIQIDFAAQDYAAYVQSTYLGKFDGGVVVWGLETPVQEPNEYLFNMYHPKGSRNHSGVDDPTLTAMIDKQRVTIDRAERKKILVQIQQYLAEKEYVGISGIGNTTVAYYPWVKDYFYETDYGRGGEVYPRLWIDSSAKK